MDTSFAETTRGSPATSNAPQIGKKRRMSDDEDVPALASIKKHRIGLQAEDTVILEETSASTQEQDGIADGVNEVTEGVREVELEESPKADAIASEEPVATETAAAIPLPDSPVLEAQMETDETNEVVSPDASAEAKEETAQKPEGSSAEPSAPEAEDSSAEPAAPEAEKEKTAEEKERDTANHEVATSDATSTLAADVTTHAITDDTAPEEEKAKEDVTEAA